MFSGRSPAVRALAHDAQAAAACEAPILIEGETGTGKGLLARWIHSASHRAKESFVDLNCAGLPRELLESELFGYEKGAFTGAMGSKPGLVEAAHRGTMFLDEIGDTDVAVQPKLLKIVEEKRFRRLGDIGERRVDVRFVAASNKSLTAARRPGAVPRGSLLPDQHAGAAAAAAAPPEGRHPAPRAAAAAPAGARDRTAGAAGRARRRSTPSRRTRGRATSASCATCWNVRCSSRHRPTLRASDLRLNASARKASAPSVDTLKEVEWHHIQRVLQEEKGSVARASKRLGIPRSSLYQKLKLRDTRGPSAA